MNLKEVLTPKKYFLGFIFLFWLVTTISGVILYSGSKVLFLAFAAVSFLLILSSIVWRVSYGFIFFTIFLWMGIWIKLNVFFISQRPWAEPIGSFDSLPSSWDAVLKVSIMAFSGVVLGRVLWAAIVGYRPTLAFFSLPIVPNVFIRHRKFIWTFIFLMTLFFSFINSFLGIQQVGLNPRVILPWPLNALIAWTVSIGISILIAVVTPWEIAFKKNIRIPLSLVFVEGVVASISILSRGILILHCIPQFWAVIENRRFLEAFRTRKILQQAAALGVVIILTVSGANIFRGVLYPDSNKPISKNQVLLTRLEVLRGGIRHVKELIANGEPQMDHLKVLEKEEATIIATLQAPVAVDSSGGSAPSEFNISFSSIVEQINPNLFRGVASLVLGRFIGIESIMAVCAYSDKNFSLFKGALLEKRTSEAPTLFQEISKSPYRYVDSRIWQFASLPGPVAFLFLSGSLSMVFFGMIVFSILVLAIEHSIFKLLKNPFLSSLLGVYFANFFAQSGLTPRQDLPFVFMIIFSLLIIWGMDKMLRKI